MLKDPNLVTFAAGMKADSSLPLAPGMELLIPMLSQGVDQDTYDIEQLIADLGQTD